MICPSTMLFDKLTDSLAEYCIDQNLPHICALELLASDDLTDDQRKWLTTFNELWETVEKVMEMD